jgi:hypothetical protein
VNESSVQRYHSVSSLKLSKISSHLHLFIRTHTNLLSLSLTLTTPQGNKKFTEKYKLLSSESLQSLIDILDLFNSLVSRYFSPSLVTNGSRGDDILCFEKAIMNSVEHVVQMINLFLTISLKFSHDVSMVSEPSHLPFPHSSQSISKLFQFLETLSRCPKVVSQYPVTVVRLWATVFPLTQEAVINSAIRSFPSEVPIIDSVSSPLIPFLYRPNNISRPEGPSPSRLRLLRVPAHCHLRSSCRIFLLLEIVIQFPLSLSFLDSIVSVEERTENRERERYE